MSIEEVASQIDGVDRRTRSGAEVDASEKSINITGLYSRYGWSSGGPAPLPGDSLPKLKVADLTADGRWAAHFLGSSRHLGVYRTNVGYYWVLRYAGAMSETWLDHIGTAHDMVTRFGG
jgi:hypothetical protein